MSSIQAAYLTSANLDREREPEPAEARTLKPEACSPRRGLHSAAELKRYQPQDSGPCRACGLIPRWATQLRAAQLHRHNDRYMGCFLAPTCQVNTKPKRRSHDHSGSL